MNETQEQMLAGMRLYVEKEDRAQALIAGGNRLTITDVRDANGEGLYVLLIAGFGREDGDKRPWIFPIGDAFHVTKREHIVPAGDGTAGVANRMDGGYWTSALLASYDTSAVAVFSEWKDGKLDVEYMAIGRDDPGVKVLYKGPNAGEAFQAAKEFSE